MPLYDLVCDACGKVSEVFCPIAEEPVVRCSGSKIDCVKPMRKLIGSASGKPPGRRVVDVTGYQPGLARYPGDARAWVDGKSSLNKLIDARRREGCGPPTTADEIARSGGPRPGPPPEM